MKYAYPAIFTKDGDAYSVSFPDLEGCFTFGDSIPDAMEMAQDALCLALYDREEDGESIPEPTAIDKIPATQDSFVSMVCCDTIAYRILNDNRAVKKTLTIPSWLNTIAEKAGINFSAVLQNALKAQLNINT